MASKTQAVLLMGHGTRDLDGAAQFVDLLSAVRAAAGGVRVEAGFLEFGGPMLPFIRDAVDGLVADGVRELLAVPVLLHDANHTNADMPREARDAQARHPALRLVMSDALGISDALLDIVEGRFRDARLQLLDHEDAGTAMLLVGRGTSDAGANSDFFKIGRLLWERNRGLLVECCFVSLTEPTVPFGVDRCVRLGARRIVVVPYFLHTGVLVKRIASQAASAVADHPGIELAIGEPMGVHPNLVRLILDRIEDLRIGATEHGPRPPDPGGTSREGARGDRGAEPAAGGRRDRGLESVAAGRARDHSSRRLRER